MIYFATGEWRVQEEANLEPAIIGDTPLVLKVAVRRNVEFLAEVGFLSTPVSFCK